MALFAVELRDTAVAKVKADAQNRWLSEAEIAAERCHDGRPVSPTMRRVLSAVGSAKNHDS